MKLFGVTPHLPDVDVPATYTMLASGGAKPVRVGVSFANSDRDGWYFDYLDRRLEPAIRSGLVPAVALGGQPGPWNEAAKRRWALFVRAIVDRYRPHGWFWATHPTLTYQPILWVAENEPNHAGSRFEGHPEQFADLVNTTSRQALATHPQAAVQVGGMSALGWNYLASVLPLLDKKRLQGVGYHPYQPDANKTFALVERVRGILDDAGWDEMPLMLDELGFYANRIGEDAQAEQLDKLFDLLKRNRRRLQLRRVQWYSFKSRPISANASEYDTWMGLIRADGSPRPAWARFKAHAVRST